MKITVIHDNSVEETEVTIKCSYINENLQKVINILEAENFRLKGRIDDKTYILQIASVFYIESVDEHKLFIVKIKFTKQTRNFILNIRKLNSVRPLLNGKMEVTLTNGEVQIVNRHYLKDFKEKFDL